MSSMDVTPTHIVVTLLVGCAMLLAAGLACHRIDRATPRVIRLQIEVVGPGQTD